MSSVTSYGAHWLLTEQVIGLGDFECYPSYVMRKSAYATFECSVRQNFLAKRLGHASVGDRSLYCIEQRLSLHLGSISPKQHEHSSDQV